jgi:polyhydroxybutyrate depolymerase
MKKIPTHNKILPCLFLSGVILLSVFFSGCINIPDDPNTHIRTIFHDGLDRTYRIHIPPSYNNSTKNPLVFVLHGGWAARSAGERGEHMEEKTTLKGFNILSDNEGFIVVYPEGIDSHWNDGRKNVSNNNENIDDVGFISALIENLTEEFNIDSKRIYVAGMSNGAMMSYRLAFELSEKIAAIAPVVGSITEDLIAEYEPSRPVSVLVISGTDDTLMPWDGGDIIFFFRFLKRGKVLSVNDSVEYWVEYNNCNSTPNITWLPDKDPRDGTLVRREIYSQGDNETEVVLYAIEGGGHTWPDGGSMSKFLFGNTCRDINANEIIWEFFKNHPMK